MFQAWVHRERYVNSCILHTASNLQTGKNSIILVDYANIIHSIDLGYRSGISEEEMYDCLLLQRVVHVHVRGYRLKMVNVHQIAARPQLHSSNLSSSI